jgi:flagellar hook-basal body complex protein FliE
MSPPVTLEGRAAKKGETFLESLKSYCTQVDRQLKDTDQMVAEFAVGKRHDIHEVVIATEKAGLSFTLLLRIRNKLLESYQEIMRMQF